MKKLFVLLFLLIFIESIYSIPACQKGSAKDLDGTIVCVSIFADDVNTAWSEKRIDVYTNYTTEYMHIATDWIRKKVKKYNRKVKFIYDYFEYGGIYYKTKFNVDLTDWKKNDEAVWKYIDTSINLDWIRETYKTDNIFFMVYINTPKENKVASATRRYYEGMPYPYEIIYINRYRDNVELPPSSYAHEILHTFGARDLYYADSRNNFPDNFVEYCKYAYRNDIMLTVSDIVWGGVRYDRITNDLSDLDAYYLGMTDTFEELEKFHLPKTEHTHSIKTKKR